jgi:MFS family permease
MKLVNRYRTGLKTSIRNNSTAYGFSIVASADISALSHLLKPPSLLEIFVFLFGAAVSFASVEAIATGGFRDESREEPSKVVALGSALAILSMSLAVGAAAAVAAFLEGWLAWFIASWFSSTAYLAVVAAEMAFARRIEENAGEQPAED